LRKSVSTAKRTRPRIKKRIATKIDTTRKIIKKTAVKGRTRRKRMGTNRGTIRKNSFDRKLRCDTLVASVAAVSPRRKLHASIMASALRFNVTCGSGIRVAAVSPRSKLHASIVANSFGRTGGTNIKNNRVRKSSMIFITSFGGRRYKFNRIMVISMGVATATI